MKIIIERVKKILITQNYQNYDELIADLIQDKEQVMQLDQIRKSEQYFLKDSSDAAKKWQQGIIESKSATENMSIELLEELCENYRQYDIFANLIVIS